MAVYMYSIQGLYSTQPIAKRIKGTVAKLVKFGQLVQFIAEFLTDSSAMLETV